MHHHHFVEESHPHTHPHNNETNRKRAASSAQIKDPHHSPIMSAYTPSNHQGGHSNDVIISQSEWETHVHRNPHSAENEKLEKKLKWGLYLTTIIFFIVSLILSISLIVILEKQERKVVQNVENSQKILNDLPRMFNTNPFHTLLLKENPCEESQSMFWWFDISTPEEKRANESIPVFNWQGTNYGCLCENDGIYFGNTCNNHPECKKIPAKSSKQLFKINSTQYLCGGRYNRFFEKNDNSTNCPKDAPFLVGMKYCADLEIPPVTIFQFNKTFESDDDDEAFQPIFGEFSEKESPIIGIQGILSQDGKNFPCIDSEKSPKPQHSSPYPFLKELNNGCGVYGERSWYSVLDYNENATEFFFRNDMLTILQELSGFLSEKYLNRNEKVSFYLERTPLIPDKKICAELKHDSLLALKEGGISSELRKKSDDLSIINGLTLAFSVIGIIIILFTTFVLVLGKYMLLTYIVGILLAILMLVLGIYMFATKNKGVSIEIRDKYKVYYEEGCFPAGFSNVARNWISSFDNSSDIIHSIIITAFVLAIIYLIVLIGLSAYGQKYKTRPILKRAPYTPARRRTLILQNQNLPPQHQNNESKK